MPYNGNIRNAFDYPVDMYDVIFPEPIPVVIVAMDIQQRFMARMASEWHRNHLPVAARQFINERAMEDGTPAIIVAHGRNVDFCADGVERPHERRRRVEELGLRLQPKPHERLLEKNKNSPFVGGPLKEFLKQHKTEEVELIGMNTRACIPQAAVDILGMGLRCRVHYDLLADNKASREEDESPEWHKHKMQQVIADAAKLFQPFGQIMKRYGHNLIYSLSTDVVNPAGTRSKQDNSLQGLNLVLTPTS